MTVLHTPLALAGKHFYYYCLVSLSLLFVTITIVVISIIIATVSSSSAGVGGGAAKGEPGAGLEALCRPHQPALTGHWRRWLCSLDPVLP